MPKSQFNTSAKILLDNGGSEYSRALSLAIPDGSSFLQIEQAFDFEDYSCCRRGSLSTSTFAWLCQLGYSENNDLICYLVWSLQCFRGTGINLIGLLMTNDINFLSRNEIRVKKSGFTASWSSIQSSMSYLLNLLLRIK